MLYNITPIRKTVLKDGSFNVKSYQSIQVDIGPLDLLGLLTRTHHGSPQHIQILLHTHTHTHRHTHTLLTDNSIHYVKTH